MFNDLHYAIRMLRKTPGVTTVAVLTLALGIGANTAIFSVVDTVLLRPLPYKDPDRLVKIWGANRPRGLLREDVSMPDFLDLRDRNHVFEQMAADDFFGFVVTHQGEPAEWVGGAVVTASWLPTLGVQPILGRHFLPDEEQPGHDSVVILTNAYWRNRFGADPKIIGARLVLGGQPFTVVGVLPPNIRRSGGAEILKPLVPANYKAERDYRDLDVVARLKPAVTLVQAQAEMDIIARQLEQQYPTTNKRYSVMLEPLREAYVATLPPAQQKAHQNLLLILGAVGLVLLIGCANVANLLLARAVNRQKEFVIRAALGSTRGRLIRQLLTESVLLFLFGGTLSLLLAQWFADLLVNLAVAGGYVPPGIQITLNFRVLAFGLLLSLVTGLLFGLAPALQASRTNLNDALKESSKASAGSLRHTRARSLLVISELALALVLVIGFALLIRSFLRLQAVPPGFNPENALTTMGDVQKSKYATVPQQLAFWRAVEEHVQTLPGVTSAVLSSRLPLQRAHEKGFIIEGRLTLPEGDEPVAKDISVSPDYFRSMSIPLVKGRPFTERDTETAQPVVIISETMARRYFPHEGPIGQRVRVTDSPLVWREIVGVVADVQQDNLDEDPEVTIYRPYYQITEHDMNLVVRTSSFASCRRLAANLRYQLMAVDKDLVWSEVRTLHEIIYGSESLSLRRFVLILLGSFAALALILAAVGIYGVMSYSVAERTREIGIRMAVGATPETILKLVLREAMVLTLVGVILGITGALVLTQFLKNMLFGVTATDPLTFVVVSLLLAVLALLACYIPTRKATKVDPMVALRDE